MVSFGGKKGSVKRLLCVISLSFFNNMIFVFLIKTFRALICKGRDWLIIPSPRMSYVYALRLSEGLGMH